MKNKQKPGKNNITEGPVARQLLMFFFPVLFGMLFQQLYTLTDAFVVGKFVGDSALASLGGTTAIVVNLLVGFFTGLASGATVVISQHYGAGRAGATEKAVHTAIALALAGGAGITLIGLLISPPMLTAMNATGIIYDYSLTYLRIYFGGIVFSLIYNLGAGVLRAVGDSKRPMIYLIVCTVFNIGLDLLLVAWLQMEVAGVAVATIVSQAVSATLVIAALLRTNDIYQLNIRKIRFHKETLLAMVRIGFPAGMQSVMYNISNFIIQGTINNFGETVMTAWSSYGKLDSFFWVVMGSLGVALTAFAGQNFGAKKYDRMRKSTWITMGMGMLSAALIGAIILLFSRQLIGLFSDTPSVLDSADEIIHTIVPFYFTYVSIEAFCGVMRGTGDSLVPMLMTALGVCVLRLVWIFTVVPAHNEISTVVMSYPVTWAVTSLAFLVYYLQGGWLRRRIRKSEQISLAEVTAHEDDAPSV